VPEEFGKGVHNIKITLLDKEGKVLAVVYTTYRVE